MACEAKGRNVNRASTKTEQQHEGATLYTSNEIAAPPKGTAAKSSVKNKAGREAGDGTPTSADA